MEAIGLHPFSFSGGHLIFLRFLSWHTKSCRNITMKFRFQYCFIKKCLYLQPEMWRDLAACNHTKKC